MLRKTALPRVLGLFTLCLVAPLAADDPERTAELSDSLTTAFLVMLEQLTPEERLVLLLADVFGERFESIAASLDRSVESCRQLASRARRKRSTTSSGCSIRVSRPSSRRSSSPSR